MRSIFKSLSLVCLVLLPLQSYSASDDDSEVLKSFRFKSKTENFAKQVQDAFEDPKTVSVDFSRIILSDEELLGIVFPALLKHSREGYQKLDLLNLGSGREGGLSYRGVVQFLGELQKAAKSNPMTFSILHGAVLKTGLPVTEEFVEDIQKVASLLTSREVRVIE